MAARNVPPSAATPASTIPSSRPRQPAWSRASAARSSRASAIGTQSAVSFSIGRPGSSVQSPSPGSPRLPATARLTIAECCWRFSASLVTSAPTSAHRRRRFSSTCVLVVERELAEVQRRERPFAYAALPGGEHDLVRVAAVPAVDGHTSSLACSSSRSRVFSVGSSTTRSSSVARTSPTRGPSASPSSWRSPPSIARSEMR